MDGKMIARNQPSSGSHKARSVANIWNPEQIEAFYLREQYGVGVGVFIGISFGYQSVAINEKHAVGNQVLYPIHK